MNNKKTLENLGDLDLFFESIGFDEKTKKEHIERITKIIFASVAEKLDKVVASNEKAEIPDIKSIQDFIDYYERYVNRKIIEKIIEEESAKQFAEYVDVIQKQLPR
jgi:Mn-dependent DtxR family transcriptional regulator